MRAIVLLGVLGLSWAQSGPWAKKGKAVSGDWAFLFDDQPHAAPAMHADYVPAPGPVAGSASPDQDPNPVPLHPDMLSGAWYTQVFKVPCKWNGAKAFTNFEQVVTVDHDVLRLVDSWRVDECVTTRAKLIPSDRKGVYTLKDNVGDQNTGDYVIVAIEPDCFHVVWGCQGRDPLSNSCQDFWVAAKTRKRQPDKHVLAKVDRVLKGIGVNEYDLIDQSNPCGSLLPPMVPNAKPRW